MNGGGSERGRHRIRSRLQALSHQPRARCGAWTHGPGDRDWAEVGRLTKWATQGPPEYGSFFLIFIYFIFLTFIYFWDRERQSMNGGGAERVGDTESEAGSRLRAVITEPDVGLKLTDREIMTWAEVGRLTDWATQAPLVNFLKRLFDLISGSLTFYFF